MAAADLSCPAHHTPRWKCLVFGYDRFHQVVVSRGNNNYYRTQFFACSRCSVMFERPSNFNGHEADPVVDVSTVTPFRVKASPYK